MVTVGVGVVSYFCWVFFFALLHSAADAEIQTYEYQRWYNENFIAKKFALMAAAAYGKEKKVVNCLNVVFPNGAFCPAGVSAIGGKFYNCSAFVAMATSDKAIILSFRGSDNGGQIADIIVATLAEEPVSAAPAGNAHFYFMQVFTALTEHTGILEELVQTLNEYPDYELWVTGHSLGGALASLAAGKLVKDFGVNEENLKLVTFGQPRTGDKDWAYEMDRLIKTYKYRVVSGDDLVAVLPFDMRIPITIPWPQPIGEKTYHIPLGPHWLHWTGEVWYPGGANEIGAQFKMCNQTNEPEDCSSLSAIVEKLDNYILTIMKSTGVECAGEVLTFLFTNIEVDVELPKPKWPKVELPKKWPWQKSLLPKVSVKMPTEDEIVGDAKKCFDRKLHNGLLSGQKMEELFGNFLPHHQKNFGLDYKGEGDSGCDKFVTGKKG